MGMGNRKIVNTQAGLPLMIFTELWLPKIGVRLSGSHPNDGKSVYYVSQIDERKKIHLGSFPR